MAQWLTNEQFGNGSNGAYAPSTGTDAPIDSACTGTISTKSLTATNASFSAGQIILIHQTRGTGAGQWELNVIASYVAGTITTKYSLTYGYVSGAQVLVLKQYRSALIDTGVTLTAKAWDGSVGGIIGWICNGTTTITGTLNGTDKGFRGASAPTATGSGFNGFQGEGTAGDRNTVSTAANGNGGGGGLANSGAGGGGGNTNAGTSSANPGTGGSAVGNSSLTSFNLGGGGGGGAYFDNAFGGTGGNGGSGVMIFSKVITGTGSITLNGSNGGNGTNVSGKNSGAGSGGAGGSVLFKGQTVDLDSLTISFTAGSGGTGQQGGNNGVSGSVGRGHADYSNSITTPASPTIDTTNDRSLGNSFFGGIM